ncbi:F-box only protein 50 isoform X1 [Entelurus aequoreus]|uniref:F-box only protein 50 isoform X1 n=1 Tax=Entelurus aequoreus TaxID=161455 RepID=UPI002B1D7C38|nr:F-box only protein 50 isoform X1 [Entelurus aequoreus]
MTAPEWKKRCDEEWALGGMAMPDSVDWKSAYEAKPFGRNLLKNPSPHGLSKDIPPPEPEMPDAPMHSPPCFEPEGDFSGWSTNTEVLPCDTSGIPAGVVVCALPQNSWFTLEQTVDLKAEGLWEKLLDDFQPEIMIQDWYEESQLHESIYQLQVKLLGADKSSVIAEHSVKPSEDLSTYSHTWKEKPFPQVRWAVSSNAPPINCNRQHLKTTGHERTHFTCFELHHIRTKASTNGDC